MSSENDQRVVEMKFDNDQFEKGVKHTIESLDKLEDSLKLSKAGEGMDDLERFNSAEFVDALFGE